MKHLLKGGLVVGGSGPVRADVLIDGEQVADVGLNLDSMAQQITDVTGMLLFPGFIDGHTHFDLDVCNTTTADDFYSGSRSALRGGTTTIVDFACPNKGESLRHGLDLWHQKADGKAACDYGFHMTIDDWNPDIRRELPAMFDEGISTFKMYMTYPAMMIGDRDMFSAMEALRDLGGLAGYHCENSGVIDALIAQYLSTGDTGPGAHPLSRPAAAEAEAVSRLLRLAEIAETPVIIVHLSTAAALEEVRAARRRGQTVFVETCPHYLLLRDDVYFQEDYSQAARYVCAPPIREVGNPEALLYGLANGEIQTIATDHCSFTLQQKDAGRGDFTKIPGGLPGVETRGLLAYSLLVGGHVLDLGQLVQVLAENPAKLYGMWPRKGVIASGSDADIVVYDPKADTVITAEGQESRAGYTPFEGFQTCGSIRSVYLRGSLAVDKGVVLAGSHGQYIHRDRPML